MVQWHSKSDKLPSGGKRHTIERCTKKKAWKGGLAADTKAQDGIKDEKKVMSGRGTTTKTKVISSPFANVYDSTTKKTFKADVLSVKENTANRLYARSNIVSKGAIIRIKIAGKETEAKVTNRPGQDGVINAVLA